MKTRLSEFCFLRALERIAVEGEVDPGFVRYAEFALLQAPRARRSTGQPSGRPGRPQAHQGVGMDMLRKDRTLAETAALLML